MATFIEQKIQYAMAGLVLCYDNVRHTRGALQFLCKFWLFILSRLFETENFVVVLCCIRGNVLRLSLPLGESPNFISSVEYHMLAYTDTECYAVYKYGIIL